MERHPVVLVHQKVGGQQRRAVVRRTARVQLALLLARRERVERLQLAMEEEKRQQRAKQRMRLKKEEVRTMEPQRVVRRKREKPPMERALMERREQQEERRERVKSRRLNLLLWRSSGLTRSVQAKTWRRAMRKRHRGRCRA